MDKRAVGVSFFAIGALLLSAYYIAGAIINYDNYALPLLILSIFSFIVSMFCLIEIKSFKKDLKEFMDN